MRVEKVEKEERMEDVEELVAERETQRNTIKAATEGGGRCILRPRVHPIPHSRTSTTLVSGASTCESDVWRAWNLRVQ